MIERQRLDEQSINGSFRARVQLMLTRQSKEDLSQLAEPSRITAQSPPQNILFPFRREKHVRTGTQTLDVRPDK
jgi:hypothetical protein